MGTIDLSSLGDLPRSTDVYTRADYVELLCLVNIDRQISKTDVINRLQKDSDIDELVDSVYEDLSLSDNRDDAMRRDVDDWFSQLRFRVEAFGQYYPFEFSDSGDILVRKETLTDTHRLYIYLLITACKQYFASKTQQLLVNSFEFVSAAALRQYLAANAVVHVFGSNPLNKNGRYSKGTKYEKIKKLADDLGEKCLCTPDYWKAKDTGDGGLDVVGWLPLNDDETGFLIVLAQCACTEDWETKQAASDISRWGRYIHFSVPVNNMTFIPYCFRSSIGKWYLPGRVGASILMDRLRLINLITEYEEKIAELPYDVVEETINSHENLV